MSDYLFMTNVGDDIINSITISNFVSNRRANKNQKLDFKVVIYTQSKEDIVWNKLDEIYFQDRNNITLESTDYNLSVGQLAVIIPCALDFFCEEKVDSLPEPVSRKLDNSPVNERAMISFRKGKLVSSYQGEFPYLMSRIKGTFIAFDPLINKRQNNVTTKLVFINIFSKKIIDKQKYNLKMADSIDKNIKNNIEYVHNSAAIMDVCDGDGSSYVFYSKDTLGIPIFISYEKNENSSLSVEHTHPPSELFWGEYKFYGQGVIKSNWLRQLP